MSLASLKIAWYRLFAAIESQYIVDAVVASHDTACLIGSVDTIVCWRRGRHRVDFAMSSQLAEDRWLQDCFGQEIVKIIVPPTGVWRLTRGLCCGLEKLLTGLVNVDECVFERRCMV